MLNLDNEDERSINKIHSKYPDRIPVIIKKGNKEAPDIDRHKFLVPKIYIQDE